MNKNQLAALTMIANAFNNWIGPHARVVMMPTTEAAEKVTRLIAEQDFTVVTPADISKTQLVIAMEAYEKATDWSAFSRKDWKDAMIMLLNTKGMKS